jgi:hypothetical protein
MQLEQAMAYSDRVDRPTRWAADIFRAAGEQANDGSLLATAADLDRKLGRPTRPAPPDSPAGTGPIDASRQILADRRGEQAAGLPGPGWMAADLALQRRLVAEWPELRREMGEALFGADTWWRELATERMALRLESDEVAAHALLWELAIPPAQVAAVGGRHWPATIYRSLPEAATRIDTRWLQRALRSLGQDIPIDGVPGPMTLDALGRVFPAAGLPIGPAARAELARRLPAPGSRPSLVILLRPEAYVESSVASHMDSGFDVADLYVPYGLDVQNVTSLLDIPPVTDRDQIAVLHVAARMDMRGGGPYFDFSPAEMLERMGSKARGTDVWPKDIARWLRGCRPGREPLVVLDPPYPGSPYDVPWQLVLRNLFAATLFAEAAAPVIIATGVRAGGASYIPPIAHCIKDGEPLAVMADALRLQEDFANHNVQYTFAEFDWTADADWMSEADGLAAQATAIFAAPSGFTLAGE